MFTVWKAAACLKMSPTPRLSDPSRLPMAFIILYFLQTHLPGVTLLPSPLIGLSCGCRHPCLTPSCLPTHRPNPPVKLILNPLWQVEQPPSPPPPPPPLDPDSHTGLLPETSKLYRPLYDKVYWKHMQNHSNGVKHRDRRYGSPIIQILRC